MKLYLFLLLLNCIFQQSFAQDSTKFNNGMLLEYYQNQRFDQAANYLKNNYPEPVTDIKILKSLAYCSQMNGNLPEAEAYYKRVYLIDSTAINVLYSLGNINLQRGNDNKAEIYFKKIIQKDSSNFIVYKQLATISLQKNDIVPALNYLVKANKLNSEDADVASDLGDMYINLKAYPIAERVLGIALKADSENMDLLEKLVKLDYQQEKWSKTINNCEKLMSLGNMSGAVLTKMGIAYFNLKDYKCCIETIAQIDGQEQTETTCYFTAASYKSLKNQANAVVWYYKTISLGMSPNLADYYNAVADSYEILKKYQKAELAYQKSLQFNEKPLTYYMLASLYESNLKSKKKALFYYKKYLSVKPPIAQKQYIAYAKSKVSELRN
jgi:tetratricopeptide (TPR) repeat protein